MPDPLAYFLTWTAYGSWLQGDQRGWIRKHEFLIQAEDEELRHSNRLRLNPDAVQFTENQRETIQRAIEEHCFFHVKWELHAQYVGISHVHVVLAAPLAPERVLIGLKAWCSRALNHSQNNPQAKTRWWSRHGSTRWLNDEKSLEAAVQYVLEGQ